MGKEKIAVLGAGKMGSGIAQHFAAHGHPVKVIYVHDDKMRWDARGTIQKNLELLCANGVGLADEIDGILSRVDFVDTMEEAADADIVFECIVENLAVKQEYFRRMDAVFPPETVLASNTSAISITEIGAQCQRRERIVGAHFWDPPFLIPLVEVIRTEYAAPWAVDRLYALLDHSGKKPVRVEKDVPGFLANRMQHALFREALSIVQQGIASPEDVDISIRYGFGMRLGVSAPIEVMDRCGLDMTESIHSYLFPHLEDSKVPLPVLTEKIAKNELGFKTGGCGLMARSEEDMRQSGENLLSGLIRVARALGYL